MAIFYSKYFISLKPQNTAELCDIGFLSAFAFSALYLINVFWKNYSGSGMELPFNNLIWACTVVSFVFIAIKCFLTQSIRFNQYTLLMFLVVAGFLLPIPFSDLSFINANDYRIQGLVAGYVFFICIQQLTYRYTQYIFLLIVIVAGFLQLYWCIDQYYFFFTKDILQGEFVGTSKAFGSFQQVNVISSFLTVFSIGLIIVYCKLTRWRLSAALIITVVVLLNVHFSALIADTGRFNLIASIAVAALLFAITQRSIFLVGLALAVFYVGTLPAEQHKFMEIAHYHPYANEPEVTQNNTDHFLASSSLDQKIQQLGSRPSIYYISWQAFLDKPLLGHGYGSFFHTFTNTQADIINSQQATPIRLIKSFNMVHPHNELLYWLVELGLFAVTGILLVAGLMLFRLCTAWKTSLPWVMVSLPLIVHSLLEYPFYQSSLHYLIFIACLGFMFNPTKKDTKLKHLRPIVTLTLILVSIVAANYQVNFAIDTRATQKSLAEYIYEGRQHPAPLYSISEPGAMQHQLNKELMRVTHNIINQDSDVPKEIIEGYAGWLKQEIVNYPFPSNYEKLIFALLKLGRADEVEFYQAEYERLFFKAIEIRKDS